jgi:hypothetical protein
MIKVLIERCTNLFSIFLGISRIFSRIETEIKEVVRRGKSNYRKGPACGFEFKFGSSLHHHRQRVYLVMRDKTLMNL